MSAWNSASRSEFPGAGEPETTDGTTAPPVLLPHLGLPQPRRVLFAPDEAADGTNAPLPQHVSPADADED